MKNRTAQIVSMVLSLAIQAFPVPLSLLSILPSVISFANIGMMDPQAAVVSVIAMGLAATYVFPYLLSLLLTVIFRKVHVYTFLPTIHLMLTLFFFVLWGMM